MIINVTITGASQLIGRVKGLPRAIEQALALKVKMLALKLEALVKTGKLNGQVLNRITGALARSIHNDVVQKGAVVVGRVFSSGDVKYAGIHEYGGTINHPGGTAYIMNPKKAQTMMFVSNKNATGGMPRTKPHQINIPERSFLRSSLNQMSQEISLGMKKAVVGAIQKAVG